MRTAPIRRTSTLLHTAETTEADPRMRCRPLPPLSSARIEPRVVPYLNM